MDEDGLIIEALEEELGHQKPVFIYTIPTFQNPTGCMLAAARREKLVQLSRQHDFLIVADEVYQLLAYTCYAAGSHGKLHRYANRAFTGVVFQNTGTGSAFGLDPDPSRFDEKANDQWADLQRRRLEPLYVGDCPECP